MMRLMTLRGLARAGASALRLSSTASGKHLSRPLVPVHLKFPQTAQVMHLHSLHTKGDQELSNFLVEEIATETKSSKPLATTLDDFQIKAEDSQLTLTKQFNDERIEISINVNHTVDAETPDEAQERGAKQQEQDDAVTMKSRPSFSVDIVKGAQTLNFTCSYMRDVDPVDTQEEYSDIFVIEEISLYEGESKDNTYAVAGDILDGYLYDLFMNMLEERGVTNDFVEKISDYCTNYEHSLYVTLLSRLKSFVQSK